MSRLPPSVAKLIPVVTVLALVCVGLGLFSAERPKRECARTETRTVLRAVPSNPGPGLPPGMMEPRYVPLTECAEPIAHAAPFNGPSAKWWFFAAGGVVLIGLSLVPMLAGRSRAT